MTPSDTTPRTPEPAITLEAWVATHGPLSPAAAFVLAVWVCGEVSRLSDEALCGCIGSLSAGGIRRGEHGGWSWTERGAGDRITSATDVDVVERVGALLFYCLIGETLTYPLAGEQMFRTRLRTLRPDLPTGVADIVIEAVTARRTRDLTLAGLSERLRRLIGADRQSVTQSRRLAASVAAASIVFAASTALWLTLVAGEPNGVTRAEAAEIDGGTETAHGFVQMEEHSAAVQVFANVERLLRRHLTPDDPRLAWNEAHQGWVSTLRGDRLTAEQVFENKASWLSTQLGDGHPYTRTVRLALAATLDARSATVQAATIREQAERAMNTLRQEIGGAWDTLDPDPVPPGVVAHVEPNAAEREGFRPAADGSFFVPLTSTQQLIAGQNGWRLHIVATSVCRVSIVTGRDPRVVSVTVDGSADGGWRINTEGAKPEATIKAGPSQSIGVSLLSDRAGLLETRVGEQRSPPATVDTSTVSPDPPHKLTFDAGPTGVGCALVWLEIPFPVGQTLRAR